MAQPDIQASVGACNDCVIACETCIGVQLGNPHMAACVRLCLDCAAICQDCAGAMLRGSPMMKSWCGFCADICDACAEECGKHDDKVCRDCAAACHRCAKECRDMAMAA